MNKTLCSSIWNDYSWLWLTSLAFPTAAYVSTFQNKTKVIVRYGAVCMCAESVDFSLFIFYGRLQCRIDNCVYSPPGLQRRWGRRVLFSQHLLRDLTHSVSMEMTRYVCGVEHAGIKDTIPLVFTDNSVSKSIFQCIQNCFYVCVHMCLPSYIFNLLFKFCFFWTLLLILLYFLTWMITIWPK